MDKKLEALEQKINHLRSQNKSVLQQNREQKKQLEELLSTVTKKPCHPYRSKGAKKALRRKEKAVKYP